MNQPATLRMKRAEYISLSAATMMLTALGIDIMLPALHELRQHFGLPANSTATANIIVFFFMGQVAQLVFGILSDRFGRLAILRIGFPLYIVGGLAAVFAPTLGLMCAARFVAGMGASAVFTTTIAGVRDRFVGNDMARMLSLIFTIFLFTPIVAPFLGMAILSFASWKAVFLAPPLFGLLVFAWSLRLDESQPVSKRTVLNVASVKQAVGSVLRNRVFLRYTTITTFLFSGLSVYVSGSERIVGELYGQPRLFPWIFAAIGLVMSLSALFNSRLAMRYGAARTVRVMLVLYTLVAGILLAITIWQGGTPAMIPFFICIGLLMAINLAIEPNSSALAMEPLGQTAGIAASVYGTIFFFIGSAIGALIGQLMESSVLPLAIGFFVMGCLGVVLVNGDRRRSDGY